MKTYAPKPEHIEHRWYVIDASGVVLGRLASEVATILRGKHKPIFAPHMDTGDHVVVVNASKIELTGGKDVKKIAYRHSGHPGGITATAYGELMASRPAFAVEKAVRGMLPKNRLGRAMIKKLHVVAGPDHAHAAQKPVALKLGERPVWSGLPAASPPAPERAARTSAAKPTPAKRTTARSKSTPTTTAKTTSAKRTTTRSKTTAKPKPTAKTKTTTAKRPAARKTTRRSTKED
jgi:large subunit ribosomal protein L13